MNRESPAEVVAKMISKVSAGGPRFNPKTPGEKQGIQTGTVIFSFAYENGLIIAADRQVSGYGKIYRVNFPKICKVSNNSALAFCGTVSGAQYLVEYFQKILSVLKMRTGQRSISLKSQVKILRQLMLAWGGDDYSKMVDFIFVGLDPRAREACLVDFQFDGSFFTPDEGEPFLVNGSGMVEAGSILRRHFEQFSPGKTTKKMAVNLVIDAIMHAAKDLGVGNPRLSSAMIVTIDAKGYGLMPQDEVQKAIALRVKELDSAKAKQTVGCGQKNCKNCKGNCRTKKKPIAKKKPAPKRRTKKEGSK